MYTRIAPLLPFIEQFITGWSAWTAWSDCAAECGKSKKFRARVCESYSDGARCEGNAIEFVECRNGPCPTWTEWNQWTPCVPSCGEGTRRRERQCSRGAAPSHLLVKHCQGPQVQEEDCSGPPCEPYWSYSSWTECGCDSVISTRQKRCIMLLNKNSIKKQLPDSDCKASSNEPLTRICSGPTDPRSCKVLITGGIRQGLTNDDAVFTPNELKKDTNFVIKKSSKLWGHNLAVIDDRVVVFGGRSSSSSLNEDFMELKALRGNGGQVILEWNVLPQYTLGKYKRIYAAHSVNTDDQTILMCGGKNHPMDTSLVKNCLLFDFRRGWQIESNLNEVIVSPTMVWHSKTKSHYLIGGSKDSMNPIACDEVKRYHNGKWTFFTKLPDRVAGAQSIVIQDRIYVFGGDRNGMIYSIDPQSKMPWRFEVRMGSKRSDFPIVRVGPRVWMFGGNESGDVIERFDIDSSGTIPYPGAPWMEFSDGAATILLPQIFLNPQTIYQPIGQPAKLKKRRVHNRRIKNNRLE